MILIVDAYNVLKYSVAAHQATEKEKEQFIVIIARYAKGKDLTIELVFDGGPLGVADCWQHDERLRICYSGAKESADEVIERRLGALKGREVLLVSTDRELGRAAARHGVQALDAADFYRLMQIALKKDLVLTERHKRLVKTGSSKNAELDALIAEHTETICKGVDEEGGRKPSQRQGAVSKHEKQLEKLLRKL